MVKVLQERYGLARRRSEEKPGPLRSRGAGGTDGRSRSGSAGSSGSGDVAERECLVGSRSFPGAGSTWISPFCSVTSKCDPWSIAR